MCAPLIILVELKLVQVSPSTGFYSYITYLEQWLLAIHKSGALRHMQSGEKVDNHYYRKHHLQRFITIISSGFETPADYPMLIIRCYQQWF
jgi:hypothetical protein